MFRQHHKFQLVQKDKSYEQLSNGTMAVRSEGPAYVYAQIGESEEILLGYGSEPFEIQMYPCFFRVACEGDVWIAPNNIEQSMFKVSDEVFTTLDRPAPLSPEMLAIQRMIRHNELERERMYDLIQRQNAVSERNEDRTEDHGDVVDSSSSEETKRGNRKGRSKASKKPTDKNTGQAAEEPSGNGDEDPIDVRGDGEDD